MIRTGVAPLDQRLGGLRAGGVYLLAGPPGAGKLALALHFLAEGVRSGERGALVSGASPQDVFDLARHFGLALEDAWRSGRLALVGFRGEYPRRIVHAAEPAEALAELASLLDGPVSRLAVDPGTLLWESRAGTDMAGGFMEWCGNHDATVVATVAGDLTNGVSPATEWVLGRATGAFQLGVRPDGLRELAVLRLNPPPDESGPITLEFSRGIGIVGPSGRFDRRRTDTPAEGDRRLLLLGLSPVPADLAAWAAAEYEVTEASDPLRLVALLQEDPAFGTVLVYLERARAEEAIEVCRTVRPMARGALLLVSDDEVRASDRARALEAGADDVLSGQVDVRELGTRTRRAAEVGRARRDDGIAARAPEPIDRILSEAEFAAEVRRRIASPGQRFFTLVWLRETGLDPARLGPILGRHARSETGDFVGRAGGGFAVVLQDSRARQAEAFLERVRDSLRQLAGAGAEIQTETLTSPGDAGRIQARLPA